MGKMMAWGGIWFLRRFCWLEPLMNIMTTFQTDLSQHMTSTEVQLAEECLQVAWRSVLAWRETGEDGMSNP